MLTGTNNVDEICSTGSVALNQAYKQIEELVNYLEKLFPLASIHLINILPRNDAKRMDTIYQLNQFIFSLSSHAKGRKLYHVDTYYNKMFNDFNGLRRSDLFKKNGIRDLDNVHLNYHGSARLGAHLKYLAHNPK